MEDTTVEKSGAIVPEQTQGQASVSQTEVPESVATKEAKSGVPKLKFRNPDGSFKLRKGERIDHSAIKKDFEAAEILDFGSDNRDQKVIFTCEHSSNKLPAGYSWGEQDKHLEGMHWAVDIGALDMARDLATHFRTFLLYAKYSRLFLDVNRVVVSVSMFRADIDKVPIELNKGLTQDGKLERMGRFFLPFYQGLKELVNKINYNFVFSIHSFTKKEDPEIKDLDVGILHNSFDELAERMKQEFLSRGYKAVINEPYDGKQGGNHSQNNSIGYDIDPSRQGILLEYRNDLLTNPTSRAKLLKDTIDIIELLIAEGNAKSGNKAAKPLKSAKPAPVDDHPLQHVVSKLETESTQVYYFNKEKTTRLAFVAEHAGDLLPAGYSWPQRDQEVIVASDLHFDKHTKELALRLAQKFETAYIGSTLSKLFIDLNCPLSCRDIFPQKVAGLIPVQLNEKLTSEEEDKRYQKYHVGFLKGILDLHQNLSAHFWFSIQSFNSLLWPETDVILSNYANDELVEKTQAYLAKKGYATKVNPPGFSGKQLFGYVNTTFLNAYYPRKRESIIFLVSSHLLAHQLDKILEDFSELITTKYLKSDTEKKAKKV